MRRRSGPLSEGMVKGMKEGTGQRWNVLEVCRRGGEKRVQECMLPVSGFMPHHMISPDGQHTRHKAIHNVVFLLRGPLPKPRTSLHPKPRTSLYPQPPRTISKTRSFSYKIPGPGTPLYLYVSHPEWAQGTMLTNLYVHTSQSISYVKLKRILLWYLQF